jgi:hypothetical protein
MSLDFDLRACSDLKLLLSDPREGDETETTERGGGSKRRVSVFQEGPRDGDETTPIRESPLSPTVRV